MPRRPPQRRDFGHIRKLPSGRYQASFTGPDLLRHNAPVTFEAKDLAIMWLLNERKQIDDAAAAEARWVSPTERVEQVRKLNQAAETLGDYGQRWIVERRSSKGQPLRAMTKKDYEHTLAAYILPTLGKRPINQITRTDVRRWHTELAIPDRAKTKAYGLLRAIMNSAVDDELVAISPVHIRGAGATITKRRVEPATPADLRVMAEHMPPRLAAAVPIAAWCALRYGELAELRRQDIDAVNHVIKVRRAVIFPQGGPVVGPPKSDAGVRDIVIPPHVWPIIEEHLDTWVKPSANALLFPGAGGRQMWHSVMGGHFSKARKAAGREDLKWHDLRHTGATMAAQVGATTAELQARLGHSTSIAAQLYQHAAKDRDRQIAERLSRLVESDG